MLNNAHNALEGLSAKKMVINWFQMSYDILSEKTPGYKNIDASPLGLFVRIRASLHAFCYALTKSWTFQRLCEFAIFMGAIGCFLEAITSVAVVDSTATAGA